MARRKTTEGMPTGLFRIIALLGIVGIILGILSGL